MSLFSIGVSGLNTAQIALSTTSNNISNVYTPGYNRELTILNERNAGAGVDVTTVERQFDYFVSSQLNRSTSSLSSLESYQNQINQIDNLLADTETGIAPMMQGFFSSIQDLAANPSDPAARQGVLGTADTLTAQFRSMDGYLQDMQEGISLQLESEVSQVNNLVDQIAKMNYDIGLSRARNGGDAPNNLLNQRDQLVADLNKRIDTSLNIQGGNYNITVGNGKPLVSGSSAYQLATINSTEEPTRTTIGYIDSAGNPQELPEDTFTGGSLGGLMNFRAETLDSVQNRLGQMTTTIAMAFNEIHEQGTDLNGDPGEAFFNVATPQVFSSDKNTGTAELTAQFDDYESIDAQDYRFVVTNAAAGEFSVSRLDGSNVQTMTLDGANQMTLAGMTLTIDDPLQLQDGDAFRVLPTRNAAAQFSSLLDDTSMIAAGTSVETGDNRNALALQALQDERIVGGNATLNQSYAALVSDVGNRTNIVGVNVTAQTSLREQIQMVQQSKSGVNLDEEAANLIRYQQFYQANAKVIDVATTILDTILGMR